MDDNRMHVCLVCHTEPDVWDGGFKSIDVVLPNFLKGMEKVRDHQGNNPKITWCLTSQVGKQRPEPFLELLDYGHEIGIHSHYPGADGRLEHQQEINKNNLDKFGEWLPELCRTLTDAGFPTPRTQVTWMFAYRDDMTRVLSQAGIDIDCSECYGGTHCLPDGFFLADSRNRSNGKPYRMSMSDHCVEGDSGVTELPVSGGFGDYWIPNKEGGFVHFSPIASDDEADKMIELFNRRIETLIPGEIDIFHIHFHLYEFLPPGGLDESRLDRAVTILRNMASDKRVCFSTASNAVDDWLTYYDTRN
ncbi:MAG: hypothetical protein A2158_03060 [Chloroflexi bacterium RBG_13_46_14]|nr:MAG: hypothetical protein A2158_03060 [Chloroflexi bacterium RBG_13_46_14]